MIARIAGRLIYKSPSECVVDVSGVGYLVFIPLSTFYSLPESPAEVAFLVRTIVREDSMALYGFVSEAERRMFDSLTSVKGIGPKLAINILSGIEAKSLYAAIVQSDLGRLTKVPGVGKKTAERIVFELRDKLVVLDTDIAASASVSHAFNRMELDALSALVNLGYPQRTAEEAIQRAKKQHPEISDIQSLLRECLKAFSR